MTRLWIAMAAVVTAFPSFAQDIDESDVARWLDGYKLAWETRDAQAAGRLFTEAALYFETPWSEPFAGSSGVTEYWAGVTADQRNVSFGYEIIALNGATAVARWDAEFELASADASVAIDGVFIMKFESPDKVSELREWWVVRP